MESYPKILKLLFETDAFQVLEKPVILTSGKIGIYYTFTEKLAQDEGKFKEFGNDATGMIKHALKMADEHPTFKEVIDILSSRIYYSIFQMDVENVFISGGQRKDWLFSGPVAVNLGIPHFSLYKNGKIELMSPDLELIEQDPKGTSAAHVADLMTTGSSAYDPRNNPPTGWIPMLRGVGVKVNNLLNVVTRLEGGEEILRKAEVAPYSFVAINEDFVKRGYKLGKIDEKQRDISIEYMANPNKWSVNYIVKNGIEAFVDSFDPKGDKLDRAQKFLRVYEKVFSGTERGNELEQAVQEKYEKSIAQILGGL